MAVERCKRCGKPRMGPQSGGEGLCTSCLKKLQLLADVPQDEKKQLVVKLKQKNGPFGSPMRQGAIDRLYDRHLRCRDLRVFVSANESGGFGDLINCLNTSQILLESGNDWRAFATCNHGAFDTMLKSFPDVEVDDSVDPVRHADAVSLLVVSRAGNEVSGSINEYGYHEPHDVTPWSRGAGLAPHEMGIMINERLRVPIAPEHLPLSIGPIADFVVARAKVGSLRFFFGYGAGKKSPDCFHVLLDRVLFDPSIKHAVVLPVGHGALHLDAYFKNQQRAKDLGIKTATNMTQPNQGVTVYQLPLKERAIFVIFPDAPIPYKDMLTLWRAADRSFTICEGDQSFSEAISACIPMAYQLWNPGQGHPHKTRLFEDLLTVCALRSKNVAKFLALCQGYGRKKYDAETVKQIIGHCNHTGFLSEYQQCMIDLAAKQNIALAIPAFVKRLWLRKVMAIGAYPQDMKGDLIELFTAEDKGAELGKIEALLFRLDVRIQRMARRLTEMQRFRREMQRPRSPNDLNYQVASELARVELIPPSPRLIVSPGIQLQALLNQLGKVPSDL